MDDFKYYKIRNGNLSLEYDINNKLSNIERYLGVQKNTFLSGILSAVISNYIINKYLKSDEDIYFMFIILMSALYLLLKTFFLVLEVLQKKIIVFLKEKGIPSEQEEYNFNNFFYKKIISQMVYVISITNRIDELKGKKEDLKNIYIMQGFYCLEQIRHELYETIILKKIKSRQKNILASIGYNRVIYIIDTAMKCLDVLNGYNEELYIEEYSNDKGNWEKMKEKIMFLANNFFI
ncbi:MAG: hypothetical protein IJV15_08455 [Lachnospiraceae bacterium]|nr:hypothetical protein [Lachnospiraceae bacterium]